MDLRLNITEAVCFVMGEARNDGTEGVVSKGQLRHAQFESLTPLLVLFFEERNSRGVYHTVIDQTSNHGCPLPHRPGERAPGRECAVLQLPYLVGKNFLRETQIVLVARSEAG